LAATTPLSHDRPSLSELAAQVAADARELAAAVLRLAGAEAAERLSELRLLLVLLAAAAVALLIGLGTATLGMVDALAQRMPIWGAAFVVAAVVLVLGAVLAGLAVQRLRRIARPPAQTLGALKEGAQWLRTRSDT